jgi:hypothetical protein
VEDTNATRILEFGAKHGVTIVTGKYQEEENTAGEGFYRVQGICT